MYMYMYMYMHIFIYMKSQETRCVGRGGGRKKQKTWPFRGRLGGVALAGPMAAQATAANHPCSKSKCERRLLQVAHRHFDRRCLKGTWADLRPRQ